jgi:hypothetical protein
VQSAWEIKKLVAGGDCYFSFCASLEVLKFLTMVVVVNDENTPEEDVDETEAQHHYVGQVRSRVILSSSSGVASNVVRAWPNHQSNVVRAWLTV